ncbi:MAG TPA: tetratricopeptide repeat protein [Fibrobacteria bacterium]|nr:tetratricopeptide repeat protein [Fibrobacteria bacterium]
MKKILLALSALTILAVAGFLIFQNLPEKRYARHVIKARLFAGEKNLTAAVKEYEAAFAPRGGYTPYASAEVLRLTNTINFQKGDVSTALENSKKFVERYPTNKDGRIILAETAFRAGDMETAMSALLHLLSIDPTHAQARMLMASLRIQQRRSDLAEEEIRVLHAAHPDSVVYAIPLARTLLDQGKTDECRGLLRRILAGQPKDTAANLMLVDSWLREGRADSAKSALDRWGATDPAVRQPVALRVSRLHAIFGRPDSAVAVLMPYRELNNDNAAAIAEIAKLQVRSGKPDSAIALYNALKELKLKGAGQFELLAALLYISQRQPAKGLELLKRLKIAARDNSLISFEIVALEAMNQGHKADDLLQAVPDSARPAVLEFRAQLRPDPDFVGGWALHSYYQYVGDPVMSMRTADSLYRRWPDSPLFARILIRQLGITRQYKRGAEVLARIPRPDLADRMMLLDFRIKAREIDPALTLAKALNAENPTLKGLNVILADLHRAKGNRAGMLDHYQKELALDSANLIALNNLAWEYGVVDRDFTKAEPFLKRLESSKNTDPRLLDTIGWILALNGKTQEAQRYFDLALILMPDNPSLLYHKGWLLLKQGKPAEGKALVTKALAGNLPPSEQAEARGLVERKAP